MTDSNDFREAFVVVLVRAFLTKNKTFPIRSRKSFPLLAFFFVRAEHVERNRCWWAKCVNSGEKRVTTMWLLLQGDTRASSKLFSQQWTEIDRAKKEEDNDAASNEFVLFLKTQWQRVRKRHAPKLFIHSFVFFFGCRRGSHDTSIPSTRMSYIGTHKLWRLFMSATKGGRASLPRKHAV